MTTKTFRMILTNCLLFGMGFSVWVDPVRGLRAFDCKHPRVETLALDTMSPGDCPDPITDYTKEKLERFQLIQTNGNHPVRGFQCKVVATKTVTYCGNWARNSVTYGSRDSQWQKLEPVTTSECWAAVNNKRFESMGRVFEIELNKPQNEVFFSHGSLSDDGYCTTETFFSNNKLYKHSFEQVRATISIRQVRGVRSEVTGVTRFENNVETATFEDGALWSPYQGRMIWPTEDDGNCTRDLNSMYDGQGAVRARKSMNGSRVDSLIVTNQREANGQHFGLVLGYPSRMCGRFCHLAASNPGFVTCFYRDGQPQFPGAHYQFFSKSQDEKVRHADTKFTSDYNSIVINLDMQRRFEQLSAETCENRRRIIYNKLQSISGNSNPHSLLDIYGPGHLVTPAGPAAAYITRCVPLEVRVVSVGNCTNEVPVVRVKPGWSPTMGRHRRLASNNGNMTMLEDVPDDTPYQPNKETGLNTTQTVYYMDPLTFILKRFPTVVPCSQTMPVRWNFNGEWFCGAAAGPYPCSAPNRLSVDFDPNHSDGAFVTGMKGSGVMTQEMKIQRDHYLDVLSHREAATNRMTEQMVHNAHNGQLGSSMSSSDVRLMGQDFLDNFTGMWIYTLLGEWTQAGLIIMALVTCGWSMILGAIRFCQEFVIYGWDGGRTIVCGILAWMGLMTSPLRWIISYLREMDVADREELARRLPPTEAVRGNCRRRRNSNSNSGRGSGGGSRRSSSGSGLEDGRRRRRGSFSSGEDRPLKPVHLGQEDEGTLRDQVISLKELARRRELEDQVRQEVRDERVQQSQAIVEAVCLAAGRGKKSSSAPPLELQPPSYNPSGMYPR